MRPNVRPRVVLTTLASLLVCLLSCRSSNDPLSRGWKKIVYAPLPNAGILEQAAESKCIWKVDLNPADGRIGIAAIDWTERQSPDEVRLQTEAGTLVGIDHGEWGGSLSLIGANGTESKTLLNMNVRKLLPTNEGVLVFTGLRHLSFDKGALWVFEKNRTRGWSVRLLADLTAAPDFAIVAGKHILIVDSRGFSSFNQEGKLMREASLPLKGLHPYSATEDVKGEVYLGLRGFVVRLTPSNSGYSQEWFSRRGCLP